ncbi:PREDICTED: homeobox protein EMX1 [Gekko japonicus]|uniref:Homeobox protein EMX1 n=1 Tax=Gekko japonicus TaxID=146911 RepID=A0ABM1KMP6_GEKJA|nr:PREDICTED: homeobox protein EMX1 [Gekko japonicus]
MTLDLQASLVSEKVSLEGGGASFPSFAAAAGRSLYGSGGLELLFPEAVSHHPPLAAAHLPHSPCPFFGPQPRDTLNFYPWVLRNRFFGHRFQAHRDAEEGERGGAAPQEGLGRRKGGQAARRVRPLGLSRSAPGRLCGGGG